MNAIRKAASITSVCMAIWVTLCGFVYEKNIAMILGSLYAIFWLAAQLDMRKR